METIPGMRIGVKRFKELLAAGEPFVLTFGSSHSARLYCLPAEQWGAVIRKTYLPGRWAIVDHRSLSEAVVIDILTNQVDADMQPHAYGFLEVKGTAGAYLVPASPWWAELVKGERDDG